MAFVYKPKKFDKAQNAVIDSKYHAETGHTFLGNAIGEFPSDFSQLLDLRAQKTSLVYVITDLTNYDTYLTDKQDEIEETMKVNDIAAEEITGIVVDVYDATTARIENPIADKRAKNKYAKEKAMANREQKDEDEYERALANAEEALNSAQDEDNLTDAISFDMNNDDFLQAAKETQKELQTDYDALYDAYSELEEQLEKTEKSKFNSRPTSYKYEEKKEKFEAEKAEKVEELNQQMQALSSKLEGVAPDLKDITNLVSMLDEYLINKSYADLQYNEDFKDIVAMYSDPEAIKNKIDGLTDEFMEEIKTPKYSYNEDSTVVEYKNPRLDEIMNELEFLSSIMNSRHKESYNIIASVYTNKAWDSYTDEEKIYVNQLFAENKYDDKFANLEFKEDYKYEEKMSLESYNQDQLNTIYYLYATKGMAEVDKFIKRIKDSDNKWLGGEKAATQIDKWNLLSDAALEADVIGKGLIDGIESFEAGLKNVILADGLMSAEQYEQAILMQYIMARNDKSGSGAFSFSYQLSSSIGNMVPAIAASAIATVCLNAAGAGASAALIIGSKTITATQLVSSTIASTLMGLSAGGNKFEDMLQQGYDSKTSAILGTLIGLSESTLQLLLGGIPGVSVMTKSTVASLLSEGFEEGLQTYVEAGLMTALAGAEFDFKSVNKEAQQAFCMGVICAGILGGASNVATKIDYDMIMTDYKMTGDIDTLMSRLEIPSTSLADGVNQNLKTDTTLTQPELTAATEGIPGVGRVNVDQVEAIEAMVVGDTAVASNTTLTQPELTAVSSKLETIVKGIKESDRCCNCGGNHNVDGTCKYCGTVSEEYSKWIKELDGTSLELLEELKTSSTVKDKFLECKDFYVLYNLKDLSLDNLQSLFDETSLISHIDETIAELKTAVDVSPQQVTETEYLMKHDVLGENTEIFSNWIIKCTIGRKCLFSYKTVEKAVSNLTNILLSEVGDNNRTCEIVDVISRQGEEKEYINGEVTYDRVYLKRDLVEKLYECGSPEIINTIFHEITHVKQEKNKDNCLSALKQAKERVIINELPTYYDENYELVDIEIEARIMGKIYTSRYLELLGFPFSQTEAEGIESEIETEIQKRSITTRIIDGKAEDVDEVFIQAINRNPNVYMRESRILSFEYKIDESGQVVPKTKEELTRDYEAFLDVAKDEDTYSQQVTEMYKFLFEKSTTKGEVTP